jgi:hypothetical protein
MVVSSGAVRACTCWLTSRSLTRVRTVLNSITTRWADLESACDVAATLAANGQVSDRSRRMPLDRCRRGGTQANVLLATRNA